VPGLVPHAQKPASDEHEGNRWDGEEDTLVRSAEYLWGADLYNHGFYWEAHEVWEALWKCAAPESPVRHLLQGLIQCAAASLKALTEQWSACQTLADKALARLARVTASSGPCYQGLDVEAFARRFRSFCSARSAAAQPPPLDLRLGEDESAD
jgi:predicted metal-dependent hydrolase